MHHNEQGSLWWQGLKSPQLPKAAKNKIFREESA